MKALTLWLTGLTLLAAPVAAQTTAELHGHLTNTGSEKLLLTWWSQPLATHEQQRAVHLEPNGDFSLSVPVALPTLAQLSYGDEEIPVFLEPGDALELHGNAEDLAATGKFDSADGAAHRPAAAANNYLQELSRRFLNNDDYQVLPENIKLAEKGFLSFLDYRRSHEQDLLKQASRRGRFTPAFEAYAEADITYTYAEDRLTYADLREQTVADQPRLDLSPGYYTFLQEPGLLPGNEQAVTNAHYQDFLLDYVHYQARATGHQPSSPDYFPTCYRLGDNLLHAAARPVVLGRIVLETIRQGHVAHAQAMLTTYATTAQAPAGWVAQLRSDLADHQSFAIGSAAPPVVMRTVDGKELSLSDFRGKLVYLMFWDSRYPAGQRELPYLKELTAALAGQPIVVLMAALDDSPTSWQQTVACASPALAGTQAYVLPGRNQALRQAYSIERLPDAVLIAEDGTLLDLHPHHLSSRALQDDLKAAVGRAAAYRAVALNQL
ncbi:TlpA family protein disulfide reductase [Hymenobacter sp. BRD67]|uniref:TlpA family protein disulfide reductase n=1 Tax=Hymenobacter sp. BRD67 TaxID=2675877 RepID=UPI001565634B|nr:redoxin family protein [Hymenobacter sp. BRD67]QKG52302.1 redoxin family protein [Hymenobacter sp. BRD67]